MILRTGSAGLILTLALLFAIPAHTQDIDFGDDDDLATDATEEPSEPEEPMRMLAVNYVFRAETDEEWSFSEMVDEGLASARNGLKEQKAGIHVEGTIVDCTEDAQNIKCKDFPKVGSFHYIVMREGDSKARKHKLKATVDSSEAEQQIKKIFKKQVDKDVEVKIEVLSEELEKEKEGTGGPLPPPKNNAEDEDNLEEANQPSFKQAPKPEMTESAEKKSSKKPYKQPSQKPPEDDAQDKVHDAGSSTAQQGGEQKKEDTETKKPEHKRDPKAVDPLDAYVMAVRDPKCKFCAPDHKRLIEIEKDTESFLAKQETAVVLFWLNVETPSVYALLLFANASNEIKKADSSLQVGAVACDNWPDICQKHDVNTWPTLIAFKNGKPYREYKGMLDERLITAWTIMVSQPAIYELEHDDIELVKVGRIPGSKLGKSSAITLGLFSGKETPEYKAYERAANALHGRYHFCAIIDEENLTPSIKLYKAKEKFEKVVDLAEEGYAFDEAAIIHFVIEFSRPSIIPMNDYAPVMLHAAKKPFVELIVSQAHPDTKRVLQEFENVAAEKQLRKNMLFAKMIKEKNAVYKTVLQRYDLDDDALPVISYIDTEKELIYNFPKCEDMGDDGMTDWLLAILSKEVKPEYALKMKTKPRILEELEYDHLGLLYGESSTTPSQRAVHAKAKKDKMDKEQETKTSTSQKTEL